jgi:hypothetical protein
MISNNSKLTETLYLAGILYRPTDGIDKEFSRKRRNYNLITGTCYIKNNRK